MDSVIYYLCLPLAYVMKLSRLIVSDYGVAIIIFTLFTKIILIPVSVWIQKNSIQMVKIQPEVNFLKARLGGNLDAIAEEQSKLYKREHYHPLLSIIPLILQVVLLLAVVSIIYHPLNYLFDYNTDMLETVGKFLEIDTDSSSYQLAIVDAIKSGKISAATAIEGVNPADLAKLIETVNDFDISFLGMNLSTVPSEALGWYFVVPVVAGLSSWVMCFTQNLSNVLQHEQGKINKYGIMAVSVLLSLYLGFFVPTGIALYWTASNLMSVAQMYILNVVINPKKYVDYEALEQSRVELAKAKEFGKVDKKSPDYKENKRREKHDYKAFQHIVNKHVVFYSEKSGFYKYYEKLIAELLARSNMVIHYVTNDPKDQIFKIAESQPRIKPYYVGLKKMQLLMMLVSCDMFVMSTPDLDKFYLKRSFIKKDIEYVYIPHDMMSIHMSFREGAFDAFDTIFCTGPHVVEEMKKTEEVYKLKKKKLVEFGYPLADLLEGAAEKAQKEGAKSDKKEILIAPSWQEDNLLDSCIDKLIEQILPLGYHVTVRPHPEYAKRYGMRLDQLVERYKDVDESRLSFELDFSVNKSIYTADLIVTDWSGIAPEFCFATKRPALFINTKIKCLNENYQKIGLTPVEISLRDKIGKSLDKDKLDEVGETVKALIENGEEYRETITAIFKDFIFNHDTSAEAGAKYILGSLVGRKKREKAAENKNKSAEKKPEEPKAEEAKAEEAKPEEAKPEEAKAEEAKPEEGADNK